MTTVSGPLVNVTTSASSVRDVQVHTKKVRTWGDGLMTPDPSQATLSNGVVEFEAAPGPVVMVLFLVEAGAETVSLVVGEGATQSLADAYRDGQMASDRDASELAGILEQIRESVGASAEARAGAEAAAEDAAGSAESAGRDATRAETAEAGAVEAEEGAEAGQELSEDAAAVAVAAAVGAAEASSDKADTTYVDAQDTALGQRITDEKWSRGTLGSADLDTVTTPGIYNQGNIGYNLLALNYPQDTNGVLIVSNIGVTNIAQVYITRSGVIYTRMTSNAGTVWPQWERSDGNGLQLAGALESQNLDDIKATGVYDQGYVDLATVERNYPEGSGGVLIVTPLGQTNIAQMYMSRTGNIYTRMTTGAGAVWPQWKRSGGTGDSGDSGDSDGSVSLVEELPPSTSWETARTLTTYEQGERFLDSMANQLPGVSLVKLGESGQGRPIRGLYVGDTTKPTVIIECAIHGDETSGREAAFIWAKEVAKSVPSWMDHICFLIIPTANPDRVNLTRGNGSWRDINRSWINQSTSEVRALTGAVDTVNPVFYLSMHEKIDRAWEVELAGNHFPWREGEPHHTVSETVHGAVLSALSEIEPKTRIYPSSRVETDEPNTGLAYLGETRNIPVLLSEIGSYNGPGNWSEDVPHPNRFRAPMDKRIKHCIAIFDTVANTMAEIVSGEPLAVPSKTSYPQVAGLDDAINSRIDAEKWVRPLLRSGDTLDDKRGAGAVGVYPVTAAVTGLPTRTAGWVEVFYNPDTSSTTQRFFAASWAVSGEWEREHWAGSWREWRDTSMQTAIAEKAPLVHEHTASQITDLHHYSGTGFPEGKVTAPVGATYTDTAATNGAVRWIKTSGTGNTGWQVEYGDTGWRNISEMFDPPLTSGSIRVRKTAESVQFLFYYAAVPDGAIALLTSSFGTGTSRNVPIYSAGGANSGVILSHYSGRLTVSRATTTINYGFTLPSVTPWPTTLPGIPV